MKKMVEDILYLNHCGASLDFVQTDVRKLLENQLLAFKIPVNHRKLQIFLEGLPRREICTDETMFSHILGNLLSNSISYTPVGGKVKIVLREEKLTIQNFGVRIEEELLPHIFEPFVRGNHEREEGEEASHGLGLYIGAYYAKQLGMKIDMENQGESVVTNLIFQEKKSTP